MENQAGGHGGPNGRSRETKRETKGGQTGGHGRSREIKREVTVVQNDPTIGRRPPFFMCLGSRGRYKRGPLPPDSIPLRQLNTSYKNDLMQPL